MAVRIIPDVEATAVAFLKANPSVTGIVAGRVATELPSSPTWPFLTVTLVGGVEKSPGWLDEQYLDLHAWADSKVTANLLVRTARGAMVDAWMETHTRGVVSYVRSVSTPMWRPDDTVNPPRPRYISTLAVSIHPHP